MLRLDAVLHGFHDAHAGHHAHLVDLGEIGALIGFAVTFGLGDAGFDPARTQYRDVDFGLAQRQVVMQTFRQRHHAKLADVIGRQSRLGQQTGNRRGVDDVTLFALLQHARDEGAQAVGHAVQVHAHHPFPVFLGGFTPIWPMPRRHC